MSSGEVDLGPLFQPLALGDTVLANRVMTSAMTMQYGEDGLISDRHLALYEERARGGVGLMFSEQLTASPPGMPTRDGPRTGSQPLIPAVLDPTTPPQKSWAKKRES